MPGVAQLAGRLSTRAALMAVRPLGPPDPRDRGSLDAGMGALLRLARRAPPPDSIGALRLGFERAARLSGLWPERLVEARETIVAGRPARRYRRSPPADVDGGGRRGTLLYFHGGGFIMGSLDTHDPFCRAVAARTGLDVISVAYRLAPENPFPAAVDDALAAWRHVRAETVGPVAVGGDSAGANLAAIVCQQLRTAGPTMRPHLQWLLHPVVDMVGEDDYPSATQYASGYLLTRDGLDRCAELYLPNGQNRADPRLSPLRAPLDGAAPAVIVAAGFDPVRDQAPAYRDALRAAGVPVHYRMEERLVHGFELFAGIVPEARRAAERAIALLAEAFDVAGDAAAGGTAAAADAQFRRQPQDGAVAIGRAP